ncbi:hypothetical protein ABEB36_011545 [Hypothenemus hampei]|uniref:Peptidase S54 rhomboid domain-containing protein n=1 Tax=Hypothenemus hampei TaxID=57062 RepID=A0ABD1E8E2_HYPHA
MNIHKSIVLQVDYNNKGYFMSTPIGTTTGSSSCSHLEDKKYLMSEKKRTSHFRYVPIAIGGVSIFQILLHINATASFNRHLRFEPTKRLELWRYVTYMFVHDDWSHLVLNVFIQCVFATLLELNQGRLKILTIYILGGLNGVLGAACLHPDLIVGASAGGYALLSANMADLILNFETIPYKIYRTISICILILFDIIYDVTHVAVKQEPLVSWQAHFFGGLTGILLGFVVFNSEEYCKLRRIYFWIGSIFYLMLLLCFIVLLVQIERCPQNDQHRTHSGRKYFIYLC